MISPFLPCAMPDISQCFPLPIVDNANFVSDNTNRRQQKAGPANVSLLLITFYFLKEAAPDITGFIRKQYATEFVVVEIKRNTIKLDDIYQTRKYAELF